MEEIGNISHLHGALSKLIRGETITVSSLGKTVTGDETFKKLVLLNAIAKVKKGGGRVWLCEKKEIVESHILFLFPNGFVDPDRGDRHKNIRKTRNSKSKNRDSYNLSFARGLCEYEYNGEVLRNTQGEAIGKSTKSLSSKKICFVENLENFMTNKHLINDGWLLFHISGRIGSALLERIEADEVMHFGDLDYVGLNEYATIRQRFPSAILYVPEDYFELALECGMFIDTKQKASNLLLELCKKDNKVKEVLDFLHKENLFLEQEGYTDE